LENLPFNLYKFPTIFFLSVWENLKEFQKHGGDMEIYLTIEELAVMLKLSEQTIRRYVLNKVIPSAR